MCQLLVPSVPEMLSIKRLSRKFGKQSLSEVKVCVCTCEREGGQYGILLCIELLCQQAILQTCTYVQRQT